MRVGLGGSRGHGSGFWQSGERVSECVDKARTTGDTRWDQPGEEFSALRLSTPPCEFAVVKVLMRRHCIHMASSPDYHNA